MINTEAHKKEQAEASGAPMPKPDSTSDICEALVLKLTEKNDKKGKSNIKQSYRSGRDESEDMSDTDSSVQSDEDSDWSSEPDSPSPLKTPRAFEKSDHLYERQPEKEVAQEAEDWSWEAEDFLQDDQEISKDTDNSYKP